VQFNDILSALVAEGGPLDSSEDGIGLIEFLDQAEELLAWAFQADPNSKVGGDVPELFRNLRYWVNARRASVALQWIVNLSPLFDFLPDHFRRRCRQNAHDASETDQ
jgi:hypothetical protein